MPVAAGLAVDWINDKVYWADRKSKAIHFYDLRTKVEGEVRKIPDSLPGKIKIFPETDAG